MKVADLIMIIALAVLAQAAQDHAGLLLTYGPLGVITGWLMWRVERLIGSGSAAVTVEIGKLVGRVEGLTRAMLMDLVSRDNVGFHAKQQAREMIAEIEAGKK